MSYLMVHLAVAQAVIERCPFINDPDVFILGNFAPDAIAFSPGRRREEKWDTHFCAGGERWGECTDSEAWFVNAKEMIQRYKIIAGNDFLFGYYTHILTDIENNKRFWTPIRLTCDQARQSTYFNDCAEMDSILLNQLNDLPALWASLRNANRYELPGLFTRQNVTDMLDGITDWLYPADRKPDSDHILTEYKQDDVAAFVRGMARVAVRLRKRMI